MQHPLSTAGPDYSGGPGGVLRNTEDSRLGRAVYDELQAGGMPRTNLLLVGTAGTIRSLMELLRPELREPVLTWHPGAPLDLPAPGLGGTLVLHDVSQLTHPEQDRLRVWLELNAGQTRVVSTTPGPLWPRVKAGAFNDVLYYRLNIVTAGAIV
jgi:sigma-54-interacting transcriptional regulator